jgi:hypothetical protein
MTEQEIDDWDEREEMLVRGLIKRDQNRRASDNEAIGSLTGDYEDD